MLSVTLMRRLRQKAGVDWNGPVHAGFCLALNAKPSGPVNKGGNVNRAPLGFAIYLDYTPAPSNVKNRFCS